MRIVFLLCFLAGIAFGVVSMLAGVERQRQRRRRTPVLNYPTLGAFLTALGVTGYLLTRYSSLQAHWMVVIALAVGLAAGGAMLGVVAGWAVPSAARDVEDERFLLQGFLGRVTKAIGAADGGELGQISYVHDGVHGVSPARSLDGNPIDAGTEIVIERIEDGVAYVETWTRIANELQI